MRDQPWMPKRLRECARCKRPAPPPVTGPEGQVAQGWATYESESELVVDIPWKTDFVLPHDVAKAIGEFDGLVRLDPDPQTEAVSVRQVDSVTAGIACPDCQAETGWDWFEWVMFMSGLGEQDAS